MQWNIYCVTPNIFIYRYTVLYLPQTTNSSMKNSNTVNCFSLIRFPETKWMFCVNYREYNNFWLNPPIIYLYKGLYAEMNGRWSHIAFLSNIRCMSLNNWFDNSSTVVDSLISSLKTKKLKYMLKATKLATRSEIVLNRGRVAFWNLTCLMILFTQRTGRPW